MAAIKANPSIWQLAGGPATRPYAEVFLKYGVGLIGPGDAGPWTSERDDDEFNGGFVSRFASELEVGDVILLRTGITTLRVERKRPAPSANRRMDQTTGEFPQALPRFACMVFEKTRAQLAR